MHQSWSIDSWLSPATLHYCPAFPPVIPSAELSALLVSRGIKCLKEALQKHQREADTKVDSMLVKTKITGPTEFTYGGPTVFLYGRRTKYINKIKANVELSLIVCVKLLAKLIYPALASSANISNFQLMIRHLCLPCYLTQSYLTLAS